ncbi:MAG: hypothetical protein V1747_06195 [Candidatus Omnitrophota bacterium]
MDAIKNNQRNSNYIFSLLLLCSVFYCSANVLAESMYDDDYYNSVSGNGSEKSANSGNEEERVVATPQPGWINQSQSSSNNKSENSVEVTVSGLTQANTDIKEKAQIVCDMGTNLGTAASLLMSRSGGGHSAPEVAEALISAGYDKNAVNSYLGSSINQSNQTQSTSTQNGTLTVTSTVVASNEDTGTNQLTKPFAQTMSQDTTNGSGSTVNTTTQDISNSTTNSGTQNSSGIQNYSIGSGFTQSQLDQIGDALGSISADKIPDGMSINNIRSGGNSDGLNINLGSDIPDDVFGETVIHEFAHVYDMQTNGEMDIMMSDLFNKSEKGANSLDFASKVPWDSQKNCPANQTNSSEDFAYTAELYYRNSGDLLGEALDNAGKGHSLLLEKVLFVMEKLFTDGDNVKFFTDGNNGQSKTFSVTKSSDGKIESINGINVKNSDGSYNIQGLRNLLK